MRSSRFNVNSSWARGTRKMKREDFSGDKKRTKLIRRNDQWWIRTLLVPDKDKRENNSAKAVRLGSVSLGWMEWIGWDILQYMHSPFWLARSFHEQQCFPLYHCQRGTAKKQIDPPRVKSESARVCMSVDRRSNKQQYGHHSPRLLFLVLPPPPLSLVSIVHVCVSGVCLASLSGLSLCHIHILLAICLSTSRNDDDMLLSLDIAHQCPTFFYPFSSDQSRSALLVLSFSFTFLLLYSLLKYACLQTKHTPITSTSTSTHD